MKIICECGEVTELVDDKDGPSYMEGDGWYKVTRGSMEIMETQDQVYFHCKKCGKDIWVFT